MICLPYTEDTKTVLVKSLDLIDTIDRFRVTGLPKGYSGFGAGFAMCKILKDSCIRYWGSAVNEYGFYSNPLIKYMDSLIAVDYILCYETDLGWAGFPADKEDAKSKVDYDREVIIKNVYDGQMFDKVTVRSDGMHFWYRSKSEDANAKKSRDLRTLFDQEESFDYIRNRMSKSKDITQEDIDSFDLIVQNTAIAGLLKKYPEISSIHKDKLPGQPIEENWKVGRFTENISALSIGFHVSL